MPWVAGQQAVINRQTVVTIERVTPSGRAVVGGRTYNADGTERSKDPWRRSRLEPLTVEIQAEMELVARGREVARDAHGAVDDAVKWLRQSLSWHRMPEVADVEKAEKLSRAIRQALEAE
jgi:hypothetical protein